MVPQHTIDELKAYGYDITRAWRIVHPNGQQSGVYLDSKGGRIEARVAATEALLWSGALIGDFLESFWFATRKV